jgi:hypothetical protein
MRALRARQRLAAAAATATATATVAEAISQRPFDEIEATQLQQQAVADGHEALYYN